MVVEVETDLAVEVGVAEIELEGLVQQEGQAEDRLLSSLQALEITAVCLIPTVPDRFDP
jgi:hypothetical protein